MTKKKVFVSFDFDNDRGLKDLLIGQSRHPDSPFEVIDHSLKEAAPEASWETKADSAIARADIVLVIVGEQTHKAPGVRKEIKMAQKREKKIVQIIGRSDANYTRVEGAGTIYKWTWANLKILLS